ncbi:MAG TPA: response regulator [Treponemataceae bacterium]|jgi:CheY-like chemotaxis protein|nr:MAG: putative transcriptional regulatory protein pdtaR [Spirochaetes bacterium ADurb.Bin215]HPA10806.1 response regulator [Treponemataceae bacterium]
MSDLINEARTKVLIAEDEPIVALDLQGMVTRFGYDVVATVDNGPAAVAAVRRFVPDIILLDIAITGSLDGIEVARKIHEFSTVPIVFCISNPDLSSLMRTKEISYAGYLLKPISPDSLATTLDTVLYKYNLEKRAELAEERYRTLEKTCALLTYFFEQDVAFRWTGNAEKGIHVDGIDPASSRGTLIERLVVPLLGPDRIAAISKEESDGQVYGIIAVRNEEDTTYSGMVIPLEGDAR